MATLPNTAVPHCMKINDQEVKLFVIGVIFSNINKSKLQNTFKDMKDLLGHFLCFIFVMIPDFTLCFLCFDFSCLVPLSFSCGLPSVSLCLSALFPPGLLLCAPPLR